MTTTLYFRLILGGFLVLAGVLPAFVWAWARGARRVRAVLWGVLAWVVGVGLKVAWALPLNAPIQRALFAALGGSHAPLVYWTYIGALTAVFECGAAYVLLRRMAIAAVLMLAATIALVRSHRERPFAALA